MNRLYPLLRSADGSMMPGNKVRLRSGHVIERTGATRDASGQVTEVQSVLIPDTNSDTPGSDAVKVKGGITWVGVNDSVPAEVRLYERLFKEAHPNGGGVDFLENLNTDRLKLLTTYTEPSLANSRPEETF